MAEFNKLYSSKIGYWWNHSASRKPHLKVIICGSAASWTIDKILNNRGGLHNRVTQRIRLLPFTLGETEQYHTLRRKGTGGHGNAGSV